MCDHRQVLSQWAMKLRDQCGSRDFWTVNHTGGTFRTHWLVPSSGPRGSGDKAPNRR